MPAPEFTDDRPVALSIAGSDCSAGAGLQADLRTFTALGVYGLTAATCVVSETPRTVSRIEGLSPEFLRDQVSLLCDAYPIRAAKTGLLHCAEQVESLVAALDEMNYRGFLVVDPVMVASTGDTLLAPETLAACESLLFPRADLITPNLDEARALLRTESNLEDDIEAAAAELRRRYGTAVLLKGGHRDGPSAIDLLMTDNGESHLFETPAVTGPSIHGTGCTLSAAIVAHLARDASLLDAVREAKTFITRAISQAYRWISPGGEIHALNLEHEQ